MKMYLLSKNGDSSNVILVFMGVVIIVQLFQAKWHTLIHLKFLLTLTVLNQL